MRSYLNILNTSKYSDNTKNSGANVAILSYKITDILHSQRNKHPVSSGCRARIKVFLTLLTEITAFCFSSLSFSHT